MAKKTPAPFAGAKAFAKSVRAKIVYPSGQQPSGNNREVNVSKTWALARQALPAEPAKKFVGTIEADIKPLRRAK